MYINFCIGYVFEALFAERVVTEWNNLESKIWGRKSGKRNGEEDKEKENKGTEGKGRQGKGRKEKKKGRKIKGSEIKGSENVPR